MKAACGRDACSRRRIEIMIGLTMMMIFYFFSRVHVHKKTRFLSFFRALFVGKAKKYLFLPTHFYFRRGDCIVGGWIMRC